MLVPVLPTLVYALPRSQGWYTDQDLNSNRYRSVRNILESVLKHHPNTQMMVASGREHSMQILEHDLPAAPKVLQVASGSGSIDEHTPVGKGENTLMATPHAGFVVVDVLNSAGEPKSSEVLVSVIEVEKSNQVDPQNSSAVHS